MSLLEKIAEQGFKKTPDGQEVYYPNGVLGKGRLVTSAAQRKRLVTFHKWINSLVLLVAMPYGWWLGMADELRLSDLLRDLDRDHRNFFLAAMADQKPAETSYANGF